MKKMIVCLFILFVLSISLFADGTPPVGSGTEAVPFEIETIDNLEWLSTNSDSWDMYYIQTADIDASATQWWNDETGFGCIGPDEWHYFTGVYDGQNHTIDNLYINRINDHAQGFFGNLIEGAIVRNLGLTNVNVTGNNEVGSLVGVAYHLLGDPARCEISNCFSTGSVSGNNYVGNLVGFVYYTDINNCHSAGSVSAAGSGSGGLVGRSLNSTIWNSYSHASVFGNSNPGGFLGFNSESAVNNCYSTGIVTGNQHVRGLIGDNTYSEVNYSFWITESSNHPATEWDAGTGKTTSEMKNIRIFTDVAWSTGLSAAWDFVGNPYDDNNDNDYWNISGSSYNDGYPFLSWQAGEFPAAPTNIIITINEDDVNLTWDDISAATYNIYRSTNPFEEDWGAAIGSSVVNSYTDEGAALETKYFYYITSVN